LYVFLQNMYLVTVTVYMTNMEDNCHIYQMQYDSNLRQPTKKYVCQGKMCLSESAVLQHIIISLIHCIGYTAVIKILHNLLW
jgi:hypothetical protein